jgi:hypothetical protein
MAWVAIHIGAERAGGAVGPLIGLHCEGQVPLNVLDRDVMMSHVINVERKKHLGVKS